MSITRRGMAILAAAALSALMLPGGLAVILFGVCVVAVATDAFAVRGAPDVTVDAPPLLSRGIPASMEVITDRDVRVKIVGTPDIRIEPQEGQGGIQAEVTAIRRGHHVLQRPATLRTGPLGLGRWYHRSGAATEFVVYPDMPQARRIAAEVRLGRFGESSRRSRGPLGLGTELESIRDYLPDDDIRQVNWRATARTGNPMSNTYRIEQEREVIVLLDMGRLMAAPVGDGSDRTRLDVAVDAAAAMAEVANVMGDRIGVIAFDDRIRRRLTPRRDGGDAVLAAIYDVEPSMAESDFELAFRSVAHSKRSFVLILTDILEETASLPLTASMPILSRHHSVTVAGVSDPAIRAALVTPATTISDAFRTSVAVDMENARRSVTTRLAAMGATVVDTPARTLPRLCVSAYLDAKRYARL